MRKFLLAVILILALAMPSWAAFASSDESKTIRGDGMTNISSQMPSLQGVSIYGFQTQDELAAAINGETTKETQTRQSSQASSQITVTATVLPVVTIVVHDQEVIEVWSNTLDTNAQNTLYRVVEDKIDGKPLDLTPQLWKNTTQTLQTLDLTKTGKVWAL